VTLIELGENVAGRLAVFAAAARQRGMEPASFHVGARQYEALMAWMKAGTDLVYITKIEINGIPVWRDERLHHIEIETVCGSSTSHLERCLSL
jgi:predicted hotdog family 3-hydroxylacyl-ACP dehydratase